MAGNAFSAEKRLVVVSAEPNSFRIWIGLATMRKDIDISSFKDRLQSRQVELESLIEANSEASRPVELDQTRFGRLSRMDALQSQAMAMETERRRTLELKRIESALKRIEDGEYGYCVQCDEEIPLKRLEQDPATPNCVDCAAG